MIDVRQTSLAEAQEGIERMMVDHFEESSLHKSSLPLDPDWDRYATLETSGNLVLFGVFDEDMLVGYTAFLLALHGHYKNILVAFNDAVYIEPEYRGKNFTQLVKLAEEKLEELNVRKITWSFKPGNDLSPLMHKIGYDDEEVVVSKVIGEPTWLL